MTIDSFGMILPWVIIPLFISIAISVIRGSKPGLELATWLFNNRREKWLKMAGKFFGTSGPFVSTGWKGIAYVFNDEDLDVEFVKELKIRLRKVFKLQLIFIGLLLTFLLIFIISFITFILTHKPWINK
jgi:hypothetical protein